MSATHADASRIVLAFSGSLESSIAIPWLAERHGAEVVTVTIDLGQGRELEEVRDRALALGAVRAHVLDSREEFAQAFVGRALKAGATLQDDASIARALARPLIARELARIAGIEHAPTIAHAGGGSAIEAAARMLNSSLRVLAPARDWTMTDAEQMEYASDRHLPLAPASVGHFALARGSEPAAVEIAFERGTPTGVNGVSMPTLDLFDSLGTIAAAHGVGSAATRDLREAPALAVLYAAHAALRSAASGEDLERLCRVVAREYAELVQRGHWFTMAREALDAFAASVNQRVSGVVRLKLFNGHCEILDVVEAAASTPKVLAISNG